MEFKKSHPKKTPLKLDLDWKKNMQLDLNVLPSDLFIKRGGAAAADDGEGDGDGPEFDWHCRDGLSSNIQMVKNEFCKERGLKPFKVIITGPPCSGKSFYGKQLAEHYNVPHIFQEKLLDEIENWNHEKEELFRLKRNELARLASLRSSRKD
jgi:site-specific DNA-cytosine methylase